MVIQTSPHMELAALPEIQQGAAGAYGADELQEAPEQNEPGEFAKILAGLLKKTGIGEGAGAAENARESEEIPLAEIAEQGGPGKGIQKLAPASRDAAEKTAAEQLEKSKISKTEREIPQEGLSEHEKNIMLAVGRMAVPEEEAIAPQTDGEIALINAGLRQNSREDAKIAPSRASRTERTGTELAPEENLRQTATTTSAANAAANTEQAEKARARPALTESAANAGTAAAANAGTTAAANAGAKKAASGEIAGEQQRVADARKAAPAEKEGRSKLDEARARRRGLGFDLHDFRSAGAEPAAKDGMAIRAGAETRLSGDGSVKDIVLELRLPNYTPETSTATTSWEAKAGQSFEDMLARELHQNFNNDIVRHASIALRDGNEGTIRLALKPESLGNVKIHLEMAENKITGHIIVESEEALRAFEREISSLEKAFRDSGFEGASLDMSLAADGSGADQSWQETESSRFAPEYAAASQYDAQQAEMPLTLDIYQQGAGSINVLV